MGMLKSRGRWLLLPVVLVAVLTSGSVRAQEFKGFIEAQGLAYEHDGLAGDDQAVALSGQLEAQAQLAENLEFSLRVFGRLDPNSSKGTYVDLPIAKITYKLDNWQFAAGFDTVFWGVAESQRVVNVINQPDFIRSLRGDVTQGQPMLSVNWYGEVFRAEAYVLPYFRERRFGGENFRTGLPLPVDASDPIYEDPDKKRHVDYAGRLSASFEGLEIGLSGFTGTLREPVFRRNCRGRNTDPRLPAGHAVRHRRPVHRR